VSANNGIGSLRRFYLLKRLTARDLADGMDGLWRSKQESVTSTPLPLDFPFLTRLAEVGYVAKEDFDIGIDADELIQYVGLSQREADVVIAAHAAL
jgi:hypothetical protein